MKKVIFLALVIFAMSCTKSADSVIHGTKQEAGAWVYDSSFKKPVQVTDNFYLLSPTWGQSFDYASKRADRYLYVGLAVLLMGMAVFLVLSKAKDASWLPRFFDNNNIFNLALWLLLVSSISSFMAHPGGIRFNNDKWVNKIDYDKAIKESGSAQPIWDSLETNCLIVDGPYNCYSK